MPATADGRRWSGRGLLVGRPELAAVAAIGGAVALWGVPSRGASAFSAAPFGLALAYGSVLAGRLVVGALRLPMARFGDVPTVVLFGSLALNLALLAAALALPLSLPVDAALIAAGVVLASLRVDPSSPRPPARGLACVALSLAAATLWSLDSIEPTFPDRGEVVFRPWADSFSAACFPRVFRDARGAASLGHFSLSGEPAPVYHYAGFLMPALLSATAGTSCYLANATFMTPFGMALTGFAAFALARWWWGPGAGTAAAAGVLLIPDASRYAIANPYLGYHWLAETGPTWVYGIALFAAAWVLVLEGCRSGRPALVAAGFAAAGLSVAFKAHMFVAGALLIWTYPALAFRGGSRRGRLAWLAFSVATFAAAARLSRRFEGVPLLSLDGSGRKAYLASLAFNLPGGPIKDLLAVGPDTPWARDLLVGLLHLTVGTFGVFAVAGPVLAALLVLAGTGGDLRSRAEAAAWPALIAANYLVMSLGLALDDRTSHMPDELLHRPLVWAYFAAAAWSSGCCYELALKPLLARPGPARAIVAALAALLLTVPLYFGQGVQVGPGWGRDLTSLRVPAGLVRCSAFLRERTAPGEVVQLSEPDRWNILGALAERPVYVADTWKTPEQSDARIVRRLAEIARFRRLTDPAEVRDFAARRAIAWYVLDPTSTTRWPPSLLDRPAFESGGFRIYHFGPEVASRPPDRTSRETLPHPAHISARP